MKKFFLCGIALYLGCLGHSAFAYSTRDCDNANDLGRQGIIVNQSYCGGYSLDRYISRQEAAGVAYRIGEACGTLRSINSGNYNQCDNIFADVSASYPNDWACRVVESLARDNVITQNNTNSYGESVFSPVRNITRAETLAMMLKSAQLPFQNTTYDDWRFSGTGAVNWQKPLMQYASDNGIISSISSFGPNYMAYRRDVFNYAAQAISVCRGGSGYSGGGYGYSGSCRVGEYYSGNSCRSCGTLTSRAYYTTAGSCIWSCESGYTKSGNSCIWSSGSYYGSNCNTGYTWNGNTCTYCGAIPTNGYYTSSNSCNWSCNSGYYKSGNTCVWSGSGNYGSNCNTGYMWNGYSCTYCGSLTSNAYYTSSNSCDWTCNSGYYKSGNSCVSNNGGSYGYCSPGTYSTYYGSCQSCGSAPYNGYYDISNSCHIACYSGYWYNSSTNSCVSQNSYYDDCSIGQYSTSYGCYNCQTKPSNANYISRGTCDWECRSGYHESSSGSTCIADYDDVSCGYGQYQDGRSCHSCPSIPSHAVYSDYACSWDCISGYTVVGNQCVLDTDLFYCPTGQYKSAYNTCSNCTNAPTNADYIYSDTLICDWTCKAGYYKTAYNTCALGGNPICGNGEEYYNGSCRTCSPGKPSNATYLRNGTCEYSCDNGYHRFNNTCVSDSIICGIGQIYDNYGICNNCTTAPTNAHYIATNSCSWQCNSGYAQSGNSCVQTTCGIGQTWNNGTCNTCNTAPSNSHYTTANSCNWSCDTNYTQSGNSCVYSGGGGGSSWSIDCDWSGWYQSTTHGGTFPTGGKGNTMSFYCSAGSIKAVKWNKGSGSVDTSPAKGISCNFSGSQAIDPVDFDGGSDEYKIHCDGTYLTGISARTNNWSIGSLPDYGDQPICTTSLRVWTNGIGYTCSNHKVTSISRP